MIPEKSSENGLVAQLFRHRNLDMLHLVVECHVVTQSGGGGNCMAVWPNLIVDDVIFYQ